MTSGVPILQALNITRDTAGNVIVSNAIDKVHNAVKEGESIVAPMTSSGIFPNLVTSMVDVGEETGQLPEMLLKIADVYDDEVDGAVTALTSILEPIMIVILALVVGALVLSLDQPLITVIPQLQGAIIVILGGIVIGALSKVKDSQAKKLTQVNLQNISQHVESYKTDNGAYPVGETLITTELYKALSGDLSGQGDDPTEEIYWPDLLRKDSAIIGITRGQRTILDGYGQSYRYRSALDIDGNLNDLVKNDGAFDIWSIGPDNEPSDENIDSKADNDQTLDDIWK